jgi:hypothetical protein
MCNKWKVKVIHHFKTHKGEPYEVIVQKRIQVDNVECYGLCEQPDKDGSFIKLAEKQSDDRLLETIIHEVCHSFFFDKSETSVDRFSKTCVTLLKKMGFQIKRKKCE